MIALWEAFKASRWMGYAIMAVAAVGAVLVVVARIFGAGRAAEKAAATEKGVEAIKRANTAAAAVDPSQEAIDRDPNNLDR